MSRFATVDFEAGERLWVGKPPRAKPHLPAEPTVTGFSPGLKIERFGVAKSRLGSRLWIIKETFPESKPFFRGRFSGTIEIERDKQNEGTAGTGKK